MELNDKRTSLEKRRVCPTREHYQSCLELYLKHQLSSLGLPIVDSLPNELENLGKNLGYHDMHALRGHFSRFELDPLNESTRKGGNPIPNQQMNVLIKNFTPEQWIYFDSEFNTCLLKQLDTKEAPLNYFEYYYGDYHKDFIPAKMKEAGSRYGITFMDNHRFWAWCWLNDEGREYYKSLPKVENSRINMDIILLSNAGFFEHIGISKK